MPDKYEARASYTDAELLALYREALARVAVSGQSYEIGGRSLTSADLPEIRKMVEFFEKRIAADSRGEMAVNYAQIKRPM